MLPQRMDFLKEEEEKHSQRYHLQVLKDFW